MKKIEKVLLSISMAFIFVLLSMSLMLSAKMYKAQEKTGEIIEKNFKETEDVKQEDDVVIGSTYVIRSTLQISDAYKSGDTSKLSDRDKETLDMAKEVLHNIIKKGMTDFEKEEAVYKFLTTELEADSGILTVIPEYDAECDNPHDVLKFRNAVCVGYATTFRMFMQMLDIECMVVHNSKMYHSWNLVKLDGEWYHTDCYYDSNSSLYAHFNITDAQCAADQTWARDFFPAANGTKYNYLYMNCDKIKNYMAIPKWVYNAVKDKKTVLSCTFEEPITADNQYAAKLMTDNLDDRLSYADSFSIDFEWTLNNENEYLLCVYIRYYEEEKSKVDEDTIEKIGNEIDKVMDKFYENELIY